MISSVCLMMADTGTNGNVTCYCVCSAGDSVQGGRPSSGFYGCVGAKVYETTPGRETAAKDG